MKLYHQNHPGRKAVVILNTQYDSAAPMIKKFVSENKGQVCPVSWEPGKKTLKPGLDLVGKI